MIPITVFPSFRATAISESVPYSPDTAMTASADLTTIIFLAWLRPVVIGISINRFASSLLNPGRIPTVTPPASFAPFFAASAAASFAASLAASGTRPDALFDVCLAASTAPAFAAFLAASGPAKRPRGGPPLLLYSPPQPPPLLLLS